MPAGVLWFRRDLRLLDNPALLAAAGQSGFGNGPSAVVPPFVLDPALWEPAGPPRRAHLLASLGALGDRMGGPGLLVRSGDPVAEGVAVARAAEADEVHVAADFGPYGQTRDVAVEKALAEHGIALVRTGSPYAVAPGRLSTKSGTPLQVFTPFFGRGWRTAGANPRRPRVGSSGSTRSAGTARRRRRTRRPGAPGRTPPDGAGGPSVLAPWPSRAPVATAPIMTGRQICRRR